MSVPAHREHLPLPEETEPRHAGGERAFVDPGPARHEAHPQVPERPAATTTLLWDRPARRPRRGGRGPTGVSPRPGHIPGLDGLRALAVIAVLLFHYWPTSLPGGYLGVDVFFVVSGFLISTLLLREVDQHGRVDLLGFWRRRARRLVPALLLVVVTSVAVARLVGGDLLVGIGRQTLGALTFTSNWLEIAAGASYFHSTSPILFVNFWSLAVEEQFYLLWPISLVLALALTRTTRQRVMAVAGIGVVSTLLMAILSLGGADTTRIYYGTDTHLMGLMFGAALAIAWADPEHRAGLRTRVWRRWRGPAVLGSLVVLVALMRWLGDGSAFTFRGGIALASLATAVLIAGLLESPSPWRRLMSARPLGWIGERSYGIYLWHWPVIVIAGALVPYAPGTGRAVLVVLGALTVTLVLSELSLRLVERPVRRRGFRASIKAFSSWVTTPWEHSRLPRLVAGGLALLLLGTAVALATAPEKSQTQRQIEQTEERLGLGVGADGDAGEGAGPEVPGRPSAQLGSLLGLGAVAGDADASAGDAESDGAGDDEAGAGDEAAADEANDEGTSEDGTAADEADAKGDEADAKGDEADDEAADESGEDAEKDGPPAGEGAVEVNGSTFTPDEDGLLVPESSRLTAFGDSLVVTSADGLAYRFPEIGFVAKSNRQWGDAPGILTEALAAGTVQDNVVLHLGTNAGVDEQGLRDALDALGPERNVVVMDLYVQASFLEPSNKTIRTVVADYPNAVVGEWNSTISAQPQALQSDGVHPDLDGMHVYAEVVARAFDELARR